MKGWADSVVVPFPVTNPSNRSKREGKKAREVLDLTVGSVVQGQLSAGRMANVVMPSVRSLDDG